MKVSIDDKWYEISPEKTELLYDNGWTTSDPVGTFDRYNRRSFKPQQLDRIDLTKLKELIDKEIANPFSTSDDD